jgi:metallo-beta-lactamase class B
MPDEPAANTWFVAILTAAVLTLTINFDYASAQKLSAATQGQRPPDANPQTQKLVPPIRIFDNLYYVGTDYVSAYVVKTSDGLIMIDSLYNEFTQQALDAMGRIGLDPKTIKYVLVTHGHSDHVGGAKAIQDLSGARVALTENDWGIVQSGLRRDIVIRDGDSITLGDTTFKFYVTPGHTTGVASMEFQVVDGPRRHKAFLLGGHNVTSNQPKDFEMFIVSIKRLMSTLSNVDVNLTSHPWGSLIFQGSKLLASRKPNEPHPFVDPDDFQAFLKERLTDAETRLAGKRK